MQLINNQKNVMADSEEHNPDYTRRVTNQSLIIESNEDGEEESSQNNTSDDRIPDTEEEPFSFIKYYHGREWSEVEHLLQVPTESEKDEDEDEVAWSPAPSQISTDSQDDPFAEDIHDLVNVLDNMIRSQSNLSCDATRVIDYLDLDLFKYETVLAEVQDWTWESDDFLSEESFGSSEIDLAPTP
ncbi:unnamed protein product [Euphydryas editha]|uniref:Uncharacterized protein n=1 Tax=Euphydryas editha TaxID=104508 RepID=A0AAU9UYY9_EUPED|nr:unnamed protein product [Euphydryas editha]